MMENVRALYEVPATMLSGAALTLPSAVSALATGEAPMAMAQRNMFQPTSPVSQDVLQNIGSAFEASKLPPVLPTGMLPSYARMMQATPPQVRQIGQNVQEVWPRIAQALRQPEPKPTMSGVGAAVTPEAVVRSQMAEQLRVPIKLTKGQATRELGQQQFEIETAKTYPQDVGKPIIQAKLDQNQRILSNFDAFIEPLGAKTAAPMNLYEVGKVVDSALIKRVSDAKKKIREAYKLADDAGETQRIN